MLFRQTGSSDPPSTGSFHRKNPSMVPKEEPLARGRLLPGVVSYPQLVRENGCVGQAS